MRVNVCYIDMFHTPIIELVTTTPDPLYCHGDIELNPGP